VDEVDGVMWHRSDSDCSWEHTPGAQQRADEAWWSIRSRVHAEAARERLDPSDGDENGQYGDLRLRTEGLNDYVSEPRWEEEQEMDDQWIELKRQQISEYERERMRILSTQEYRGWVIEPYYLPQYARFSFTHKDYDGPEDGRHGTADTIDECKYEIDERES
jgi:hypothetical protein